MKTISILFAGTLLFSACASTAPGKRTAIGTGVGAAAGAGAGAAIGAMTGDVKKGAAIGAAAAEQGVFVSALGPRFLRLVTHLDVDDDGIDHAIAVLAPLIGG